MNDLSRDIGSLEARMDEHDKRFDRLDKKIDDGSERTRVQIESGFASINHRLDAITATENRRKGAVGLVKFALGSAGLYGLWEVIKGLFHR
jgi:hypothetical protein